MQAVKGYLADGRFTPIDSVKLPDRVRAILVFHDESVQESAQTEPRDFWHKFDCMTDESKIEERQTRMEWLNRLKQALADSAGEDLPDFPSQELMKEPVWLEEAGIV